MMMVVHNSCEPFLSSGISGPFPVQDNEVWSLVKTNLIVSDCISKAIRFKPSGLGVAR
jgi:hypothetical protein